MKSQLSPEFNAEVLYQDKRYSIEKYLNSNTGKFSLCVIREKTFTEWVMVYSPGWVAYDNPFNLSNSIKERVRTLSMTLNP